MMSILINSKQSQQQNRLLRVAVSACLLGQRVRYDGNQKQHAFVCRQLQKWISLEGICPEVEIGMGVPRPPIQLRQMGGRIKAVGVEQTGLDVTQQLKHFARMTAQQLSDIDGYIFKARSPSCGVTTTPIKLSDGSNKNGTGLFAAQIIRQLPLLPVVEESKLENLSQQINFLQRVSAYQRWRNFVNQDPSWSELRQFHQANRFNLMAHGIEGLRCLNSWLVEHGKNGRISRSYIQCYGQQYMAQFTRQASRRRHEQVLRRIAQLLRPVISEKRYVSLVKAINRFQHAELSLYAVVLLLRKHQASVCLPELEAQTYLDLGAEMWRWAYKNQ